ncbi:TetR/AcrR family transcriptional regulator [Croceicoccus sp. BE223]|uniref:TetR/AcrR family transcriptional regulator n=1 Tax=Croceicoccus sp. BE223 TaxID=2817716 RepID=UPI002859DBA8|nr:TetR/AcrR family transcriptional regulator [Croceicoccus sp. BE223]MDR7101377.1 AcrR family transcriptional regulator [Croceicoccus sp. BE223]
MDRLQDWDASVPAWMGRFDDDDTDSVRRQDFAEAAIRLVASEGFEGLTFRRLAAVKDCSTTTIASLFGDRQGLWMAVYRMTVLRTQTRIRAAYVKTGGSPVACILAQMPVTAQGREDWAVYLAQNTVSAANPIFADEYRRQVRYAVRDFAELLNREHEFSQANARRASRVAFTLCIGIAVQAMFEPLSWSARRQESYLRAQFELNGIPT